VRPARLQSLAVRAGPRNSHSAVFDHPDPVVVPSWRQSRMAVLQHRQTRVFPSDSRSRNHGGRATTPSGWMTFYFEISHGHTLRLMSFQTRDLEQEAPVKPEEHPRSCFDFDRPSPHKARDNSRPRVKSLSDRSQRQLPAYLIGTPGLPRGGPALGRCCSASARAW
jgi:hypothetical protein